MHGTSLVFSVMPNEGDAARFGFIVSRSVGGAVERNRVKRRLRYLAADQAHLLEQSHVDVVVRALPASVKSSFQELSEDFSRALRQSMKRSNS